MFKALPPEDQIVRLRFGGGLASRASHYDVDPRECVAGQNFDLDVENLSLRPRKPFVHKATVTNGKPILGYAQVDGEDGRLGTIIQTDDLVYPIYSKDNAWVVGEGYNTGPINAGSRLRGEQRNTTLIPYEVPTGTSWYGTHITDLALKTPVRRLVYNGSQMNFEGSFYPGYSLQTLNGSTDQAIRAKFSLMHNDRLWLANLYDESSTSQNPTLPHMIVGSTVDDFTTLSVSDKVGAGGVGAADAFYILSPDGRPINGMLEAFGRIIISTKGGRMWSLTGSDATDFAFTPLYPDSNADNDEGVVFAGNDVLYSRQGRIDTLAGAEAFGDVNNDDISRQISNIMDNHAQSKLVFHPPTKKLYVFPPDENRVWVFHKSIYDQLARDVTLLKSGTSVSPWSSIITTDSFDLAPTTVWTMLDPVTRKQEVYMGANNGKIYQLDGDYGSGDGSDAAAVSLSWLSKPFPSPTDNLHNINGTVYIKGGEPTTVTLQVECGGSRVSVNSAVIAFPSSSSDYWNDDQYWNDGGYWGGAGSNVTRSSKFSANAAGSSIQLRITVDSKEDYSIEGIDLEFKG